MQLQPIDYLARYTGKHEDTHRELDQFFAAVGYPGYQTNRVAWCAAARGWALIQAGYGHIVNAIPREHRLMARSWDVYEDKLKTLGVERLGGPEAITQGRARPGDIVTYNRNGTTKTRSVLASGHTDFFTEYKNGRVYASAVTKAIRSRTDPVPSTTCSVFGAAGARRPHAGAEN